MKVSAKSMEKAAARGGGEGAEGAAAAAAAAKAGAAAAAQNTANRGSCIARAAVWPNTMLCRGAFKFYLA